ncbi:MAG: response regulator [Spirochaetales bacterium]|nr:response regulator [Spirochaetales bacterium]
MEIIVLERTKELGNALALLLVTFGLKGIPVCSRAEAMDALQHYPDIQCGIIDIDNKSTEGLEFIADIRGNDLYKDIKIIIHTAQKINKIESTLIQLGVLGSIFKPFEETRTLHQLKKILSSIYFFGAEKRSHIRIRPEPDEIARVHFLIKYYPHLIYGKILDISMGGMALDLLKSPPAAYVKEGISIPQLLFTLDCKQISASGIIKLVRGKLIVIHFHPLQNNAKTAIARYIFKRISAE